ncbi:MAG: DUF1800 domain-containing protein [SAR202 cluster bacterium]|nr:DUF1800 domain-containing protein [SAR202 cluster bacterium]
MTTVKTDEIALIAHLMRRAGFGASRAELEKLAERGYDATLEMLLDPDSQPDDDLNLLYRYHPYTERPFGLTNGQHHWLYRMVTTKRPLAEKMALFWHQVFATGHAKVESAYELVTQIDIFRKEGMGNYRDLLVTLASNPSMIFWLDNNENHKRQPNENWGRELLELFSMGIGNYTEKDVFEASRAFTGWTINTKLHWLLWGPHLWNFEYRPEDHDAGEKTFLGHKGRFNGEDIIDIIVQQPGCHTFIARHLYNFFVADEPQVPAWSIEPPRDPAAIKFITDTFVKSDYEIKPVMKAIFTSDFFKNAMYQKVKNPAELMVETLKVSGDMNGPDPRWTDTSNETGYMGQSLLDPPSVEGWHTGKEWINSGALVQRVNFATQRFGNPDLPGISEIIRRIATSNGVAMTADKFVDRCIDLMGPVKATPDTRRELIAHIEAGGPISWATREQYQRSAQRASEVMALIAGTREYQFG